MHVVPKETMRIPRVRQSVRIPVGPDQVTADFMTFHGLSDAAEHVALGFGAWKKQDVPLVRLHSECLTGDVFGSARCDCGEQLRESMERLAKEGGILIYLRQEGRGVGLYNKIDAYALQDAGHDTFAANTMLNLPADGRNFRVSAEMLTALGKRSIKIVTNNPDKLRQLESFGITIAEKIPTGVFVNQHNRKYIEAKIQHSKHSIDLARSKKSDDEG